MPCLLDFSYITLSPLLSSAFIHSFIQQTNHLSHIIKYGSFSCSFSFSFSSSLPSSSSSSSSSSSPMDQTDMSIPSRHHFDQPAQQFIAENASRILRLSSGNGVLFLLNDTFSSDDSHSSHRFFITCTSCKLAVNLRPTPFLSAYLKIILH